MKYFLILSFSLNLFLLKYLLFKKVKKEILNPIKILPREEALDSGLPFVKNCLDGILMKKIDIKEKILNPKISVVIPCYNCKKYIKSALRSVQNQNMTDIEIIIQNDDSNNETVNLLNELLKEDPRIEIYNNDKNMNLFYTRSVGVLKARGKYLITLDADDLFLDADVFDTVYMAAEDGNFDIIAFRVFMASNNNLNRARIRDNGFNYKEHNLKIFQPELSCYMLSGKGNDLNIWGKLYRTYIYKSAVNVLGKERISHPLVWEEDACMLLTIMNLASSYKFIKKYGLFYRGHADSFSNVLDENTKIYSTLIRLDIELDFAKKECSNYPALQLINGKNHFNKANDDKSKFYLKKVIRKVLYSDKIDSKNKEEIKNAYSNYLPNGSYVNES